MKTTWVSLQELCCIKHQSTAANTRVQGVHACVLKQDSLLCSSTDPLFKKKSKSVRMKLQKHSAKHEPDKSTGGVLTLTLKSYWLVRSLNQSHYQRTTCNWRSVWVSSKNSWRQYVVRVTDASLPHYRGRVTLTKKKYPLLKIEKMPHSSASASKFKHSADVLLSKIQSEWFEILLRAVQKVGNVSRMNKPWCRARGECRVFFF